MPADILQTVQDYVRAVRVLLQDKVHPYRYQDNEIVDALNLALLEARRVRSDLFVTRYGNRVPAYDYAQAAEEVPVEAQFRLGFMYGIAWQVLLRDQEDVQDERANSFSNIFHTMLVGVAPPPVQGGTPGPGNPQR